MKRSLAFLVPLSLVLSLFSAAPSHAIFGLSACEKLKSRTIAEENVGKGLWQSFNNDNAKNLPSTGTVWIQQVVNDLLLLFGSDLKVFSDMNKYPKCFTPKQNVFLRQQLQSTQSWLAMLNSKNEGVKNGGSWNYYNFKGVYDSYYEIYNSLKGVK